MMQKPLTDADIELLEEEIPEHARRATSEAYREALASGSSVLVVQDGFLYEVKPDGTRTKIKEMPPRTRVTKGQKLPLP